ncbi:hypothetical protein Tco_0679775 [Tanacetum coccineum]|uniref:PB1-like domain-containing protein n=1 Tax=Tanacetum coccineum TaxID=301880 RepID=A0ABQ4XJM5_9ASTR
MEKLSFDLNVRKESSGSNEAAQYGGNPMSVSFKIYHGGCFTPIPSRSYVGGQVSYIDVVEIDEFCLHDLKEMIVKLGYGVVDLIWQIETYDPFDDLDEDLDYDPKYDELNDDDEHILKDVLVSINNFNFNPESKRDLNIAAVEVQEHDPDVIDYDSFGSDLDDEIDSDEELNLQN